MEESTLLKVSVNYSKESWYFLGLAVVISSCNQMQRFMIGFISAGSDMLSDTHTSSFEYGILSGTTFLLVYAAFAMPVSWVVDHVSRLKWMLLGTCLGFNAATGLTALATNFGELVWPRALMAIFSAGVDPTLFRMLAYYFPPEMRGAASGILFIAVYLGSAVSALTLIITRAVNSWRLCYLIVACACGAICCGFGMLLKDVRIETYKNPESQVKTKLSEDLRELCKNRTLVLTMLALFCRYLAGFGRGFFEGPYFTEEFPNQKVEFTVLYFVFLLVAPISLYVFGWISDKKESTKPQWRPLICAVTCWVAVPFLIIMYLSNVFWLSMLGLSIVYAIGETYLSVSFAMLINVTTPHIRALQTGWMLLVTCVAGVLSTLLLGYAGSTHQGLRFALLAITLFGYGGGGLIFFITAHYYPKDLAREQRTSLAESLNDIRE